MGLSLCTEMLWQLKQEITGEEGSQSSLQLCLRSQLCTRRIMSLPVKTFKITNTISWEWFYFLPFISKQKTCAIFLKHGRIC